jgi:hypothetical protein
MMLKIDTYEEEVLNAYEVGMLKSVASKEDLAKFKAVARTTLSRSDGEHPPESVIKPESWLLSAERKSKLVSDDEP